MSSGQSPSLFRCVEVGVAGLVKLLHLVTPTVVGVRQVGIGAFAAER
jgi:hypothetical protein